MAVTRATQQRRLASLDDQIAEARDAFERHTTRATAAEQRAERLQKERDWLAQAPVADPLPEPDGGTE
jgi:hypothetical protein